MKTRDDWLSLGLAVLAAQGEQGLRVDRLARQMGLTKGSFHHHFRGMADYRQALLERYERDQLTALRQLAAGLEAMSAHDALRALPSRAADLLNTDAERSVRAWGNSAPEARGTQERIDAKRLEFLRGLWTEALGDDERGHTAALVPHLLAIGASVVQPPLDTDELLKAYDLLARLVAAVAKPNPS
jgi:AcrR family transcriptional regulator